MTLLKLHILLCLMALLLLAVPSCAEEAQTPTAASIDTTVTVFSDGSAHVVQHVIITDIASTPVIAGALTVEISPGQGLVDSLIAPGRRYSNISVTTQDGQPVEYTVKETGGGLSIDAFSGDALMPGWNCHLVIAYDVDSMVSGGILADRLALSNALSGADRGETRLTLILPDGVKVLRVSGGATIEDKKIIWRGMDADRIDVEFSRLPFPDMPLPPHYMTWSILILLALAWAFKPA